MMDSFAQILQWLPRGDASTSNNYYGNVTPFKVQFNFETPIFEGQIDTERQQSKRGKYIVKI